MRDLDQADAARGVWSDAAAALTAERRADLQVGHQRRHVAVAPIEVRVAAVSAKKFGA